MLILISNPTEIAAEATVVNCLFDEGLDLFHVRRPQGSEQEVKALLGKIHKEHHPKLSLHQHHQLASEYGINRIHFSEQMRLTCTSETLKRIRGSGYELSTSVHKAETLEFLDEAFDYAFLGPVFNSISKPGYTAQTSPSTRIPQQRVRVIAIGGITASNIDQLKGTFHGAAVLGSIWSTSTPISHFRQIRRAWDTKDQ